MWIKPSELPEDFHQSCWVCYRGWTDWFEPKVEVVVNNSIRHREYYDSIQEHWSYMDDHNYRVMLIEKPEKPE